MEPDAGCKGRDDAQNHEQHKHQQDPLAGRQAEGPVGRFLRASSSKQTFFSWHSFFSKHTLPRGDGTALLPRQVMHRAVGVYPLPPGRAVIGPALRAAAVFLVVIALPAGFALNHCHTVFLLIPAQSSHSGCPGTSAVPGRPRPACRIPVPSSEAPSGRRFPPGR